MTFTKLVRTVALSLCAVVFAGCAAAPKVRVDQDTSVNLAAYKTFNWLEPKELQISPSTAGEPSAPKPLSTLQGQRVRSAIVDSLQAKGYTFDETRPEFRATYVLHLFERPKDSGMRIGLGAGGGSGRVGGGVGLSLPVGKRTRMVGNMTIDIVDVARNAQVWTGTFEDTISAEASDDEVRKLVDAILGKFPARAP